MMPIAPLMIEHRLIERMIWRMDAEIKRMKSEGKADIVFIDKAVDFIRTYADKLHHGKEEDILFKGLREKEISNEHNKIMCDLIEEHKFGRKTIGELVSAKEKYAGGDRKALADIITKLETLADFYPRHIEKEDRHFFIPVMDYFNKKEQEAMLVEMNKFDQGFIHSHYKSIVEKLEEELKDS